MYIKINEDGTQRYPYSFQQLKSENPSVSYSRDESDAVMATLGLFPVTTTQPEYDPNTQTYSEAQPTLVAGVWTQTWDITDLTQEELDQREAKRLATLEGERLYAYRQESDPLFFKAQRGEATMQDWLDKVAEIKARYQ